jgi:hypothetical protein
MPGQPKLQSYGRPICAFLHIWDDRLSAGIHCWAQLLVEMQSQNFEPELLSNCDSPDLPLPSS